MSNCLYKGIKLRANAKNLRKVKCKHHYSIKKLNVTLSCQPQTNFCFWLNRFLNLVQDWIIYLKSLLLVTSCWLIVNRIFNNSNQ